MKPGKTSLYLTERLANLLDAHGPASEGKRNLGAKLSHIATGWDAVMRDEAREWRRILPDAEWDALVKNAANTRDDLAAAANADDCSEAAKYALEWIVKRERKRRGIN